MFDPYEAIKESSLNNCSSLTKAREELDKEHCRGFSKDHPEAAIALANHYELQIIARALVMLANRQVQCD